MKAAKKMLAILMFIVSFLSLQSSFAQEGTPKLSSPIPVSPNAAALGKFGEIPVGLYSGIPNIRIPFFEASSGTLKFPIDISYHAGGIKVEETPSWVGLGWNLNAGGTITRQVRGRADDHPGGFLETHSILQDYLNNLMTPLQVSTFLMDVYGGTTDTQQDIFYYNVGTESGKFILGTDGVGISIPLSKTQIKLGTFFGVEKSWQIITTDGNIYYFLAKEVVDATTTTISHVANFSYNNNATNTWYLTKVQDASGAREITFEYEDSNYFFKNNAGQSRYLYKGGYMGGTLKSYETSTSLSHVMGHRLKKIKFENGEIIFNRNNLERVDLPGDYALNSIEIRDNGHSLHKKIQFHQKYVASNDPLNGATSAEQNRLILDSVSILNKLEAKEQTYRFDYHDLALLPSRLSFNQDHWGFYNGASNHQNIFVPTTTVIMPTLPTSSNWYIPGADRLPNESQSKTGTLKEITYPLGGKTVFEYENNRANNAPADLDYVTGYMYPKILADGVTTNYSTNFSVAQGFSGLNGVYAEITINNGNCPPSTTTGCPVTLLTMPDNSIVNINSNTTMFLPVGNYTLTADLSNLNDPNLLYNYSILIKIPVGQYATNQHNMMVGGLRIKKITNYDKNGNQITAKRYTYQNPDSASKSSGFLISFPKYQSELKEHVSYTIRDITIHDERDYFVISSGANIPLSSTQNSAVGYEFVQEFNDELGVQGKTESQFSRAGDIYFDELPFAPATSREWKRGFLLENKVYRYNPAASNYQMIQKTSKSYSPSAEASYEGLKIGKNEINQWILPEKYVTKTFLTTTGWIPLVSETVTNYETSAASEITKTTNYEYGTAHLLPTKISVTGSNGDIQQNDFWYPTEMVSTSNDPTGVYQAMINKNVINPLIQQKTTVNSQTTQLQKTNYTQAFTNLFVPASVEVLNTHTNTNEIKLRYHQYDQKGNLVNASMENGPKINYLWSYKSTYPIAEIKNADYANIVNILGSTAINDFSNLSSPDQNTINNFIAPLKTALPNSFISSYTYLPLVGIKSQTDYKGTTVYYEYDAFDRLENIKDHLGHIVKNYSYHNASNVNTTANWVDTYVKTCEQLNGTNTGNELMQQIDNNPNSPTYNTYRTHSLGNTGNCPTTLYAKLFYENFSITPLRTKADVVVKFFSDAACTAPTTVSNLSVPYKIYDDMYNLIYSSAIIANGSSTVIEYQGFLQQNDEWGNPYIFYEYLLSNSSNYTIVN